MIFNCAQIISYCSKAFALEAGDVIFTGTCEGVIKRIPTGKAGLAQTRGQDGDLDREDR